MANPNPNPATRFKKGQIGNPSGKKGPHFAGVIRQKLEERIKHEDQTKTIVQMIVDIVVEEAKKGDMRAVEWLADRSDGKATDHIHMEGPIEIVHHVEYVDTDLDGNEICSPVDPYGGHRLSDPEPETAPVESTNGKRARATKTKAKDKVEDDGDTNGHQRYTLR